MLFGMTAQAKTDDTIKTGIYAGDVELSGMTAQEATAVIEEHIEGLKDVEITLLAANDHDVTTTAGDLGVTWKNPELVQEALDIRNCFRQIVLQMVRIHNLHCVHILLLVLRHIRNFHCCIHLYCRLAF
ncbi:hypothetical protein LEA_07098 [human gut metagenome]|uniref:Uncharacterized protein n=1 Tax=human gut metagenome TaxID=408170 RepID=K1TVS9_9ZZZZ